ncbi:MAG: antibiotic biosynthesis monooxygenase [Acidobacteria bacterium]|nr:antibiotic biosynthesis monooxygenase [Acidobacteriota bacterium]
MHGQINKITAVPEHRAALQELLLTGIDEMPGCLSYIVSADTSDANVLWVTEVWDSERSQEASLEVPAIKQAIAAAMPMIAGFDRIATVSPVGGTGLGA